MTLREKIYTCRKKAGLSQEELAEKLEVSRQAISKWENGEAVPETAKLPMLAKTFGVTIDWLLSEEEPVREEVRNTPEEEAEAPKEAPADDGRTEQTYTYTNPSGNRFGEGHTSGGGDWTDKLPGVLRRLVMRWGWLAGVYIAVGGAGITGIGALAKYLVNRMLSGFGTVANNMMSSPMGSGIEITDQYGNPVTGADAEMIYEAIGGSGGFMSSPFDAFGSGMTDMLAANPVTIVANVLLAVGIVIMAGGIVLAVFLRKWGKENE